MPLTEVKPEVTEDSNNNPVTLNNSKVVRSSLLSSFSVSFLVLLLSNPVYRDRVSTHSSPPFLCLSFLFFAGLCSLLTCSIIPSLRILLFSSFLGSLGSQPISDSNAPLADGGGYGGGGYGGEGCMTRFSSPVDLTRIPGFFLRLHLGIDKTDLVSFFFAQTAKLKVELKVVTEEDVRSLSRSLISHAHR